MNQTYLNHSRSMKQLLVVVQQEGEAFALGEAHLTAAAAVAMVAVTTVILSVALAMEVPPLPDQPTHQPLLLVVTPGLL